MMNKDIKTWVLQVKHELLGSCFFLEQQSKNITYSFHSKEPACLQLTYCEGYTALIIQARGSLIPYGTKLSR